MANQDILGGLKSALSRGYSLEEAMLSFLNGGYKKEDIEEAAQSLQAQIGTQAEWLPQPIWAAKQKQLKPPLITSQQKPSVQPKPAAVQPKQVVTKGVAAYAKHDNSRIRGVIIVLVVLLIILLGILGSMYFFRDQIIEFINGLF
jgi:hypothetical protein